MQKLKKNWKKIAIGLSVFLLAIAGYLVYTFEVKDYDTADEEVDEITKDEIEVDLPDDTTITVDQEGKVTTGETAKADAKENAAETTEETATDAGLASSTDGGTTSAATAAKKSAGSAAPATASSSNGTSSDGSSNNESSDGSTGSGSSTGNTGGSTGNTGSNGSGNDDSSNRVTVSQIKEKYEPSLVGLENTANDRIDALVSRAKAEYLSDDSVNYARYYNKYTTAADELESRADTAFYAVVAVMKSDLKANGLAESHTKSVVEEYESAKKQRKSALMKQATELR